jgi:hypothetical protein
MGRRYSLFYILGCVASAFAGLLARGVCRTCSLRALDIADAFKADGISWKGESVRMEMDIRKWPLAIIVC